MGNLSTLKPVSKILMLLSFAFIFAIPFLFVLPNTTYAVTFTVNSDADDQDDIPGDGFCSTALAECTLRAAIEESNALAGMLMHTINFDDAYIIVPETVLPTITHNTEIDGGLTPSVMLSAPEDANFAGLTASVPSVIKGLSIVGFSAGVSLLSCNDCEIYGNYLGVEVDGETVHGNGYGIYMTGGDTVTIGSEELPNVISGNTIAASISTSVGVNFNGNLIGVTPDGTAALGDNTIGISFIESQTSTIQNNTVGSMEFSAIKIQDSDIIEIFGNKIGTDLTGNVAIPNDVGVYVTADSNNITIGDADDDSKRNIISGNSSQGIYIEGQDNDSDLSPDNVEIENNFIGLDTDGLTTVSNSVGIEILEANNISVGGALASQGNYISGNTDAGILLNNICPADLGNGTLVANNKVGLDADESTVIGNNVGINVSASECASYLTISNNTVVGSDASGMLLESTNENSINSNNIGVDTTGEDTLGDTTGNGEYGIYLANVHSSIIGEPEEGNTIGLNENGGIYVDAESSENYIQSNYIGLTADLLEDVGNLGAGITLESNGLGGFYGGFDDDEMNLIAFNAGAGILDYGTGAGIKPNLIIDNDPNQGVDLLGDGGPTPNDNDATCVSDCIINFPVITTVENDGAGNISLSGIIRNSFPSVEYIIEFFSDPTEAIYFGQAKQRLTPNEDNTITTDADGNLDFIFTFDDVIDVNAYFTAQLFEGEESTDAASEFGPRPTSEYSIVEVDSVPSTEILSNTSLQIDDDGNLSDIFEYVVILQTEDPNFTDGPLNLVHFVNAEGTLGDCIDDNCSNGSFFTPEDFPIQITGLTDLYNNGGGYNLTYVGYELEITDSPLTNSSTVPIYPDYFRATNEDYDYDAVPTEFICGESIYIEFSFNDFANDDVEEDTVRVILVSDAGDSEMIILTEILDTGIFRGSILTEDALITHDDGVIQEHCSSSHAEVSAELFNVEYYDDITLLETFESYDDIGDLDWQFINVTESLIDEDEDQILRLEDAPNAGLQYAYVRTDGDFGDYEGTEFDGTNKAIKFNARVDNANAFAEGVDIGGEIINNFTFVAVDSDNRFCGVEIEPSEFENNIFETFVINLNGDVLSRSYNDTDCNEFDPESVVGFVVISVNTIEDGMVLDLNNFALVNDEPDILEYALSWTGTVDPPAPQTGSTSSNDSGGGDDDSNNDNNGDNNDNNDNSGDGQSDESNNDDQNNDSGQKSDDSNESNSSKGSSNSKNQFVNILRSSAPELVENQYNDTDILLFAEENGDISELVNGQIYLSRYFFPYKSSDHNFVILGGVYNDDQARNITFMAKTPDGLIKLGTTKSSANGLFYFINETYLAPGKYDIYAYYRPLFGSQITSETLSITIDPSFDTKIPIRLDEFSGKPFSELLNAKNISFDISTKIYAQGQTESSAKVLAMWSSLLSGSQALADISNGNYYVEPDSILRRGHHKVLLVSYDLTHAKSSSPIVLEYQIGQDYTYIITITAILILLIILLVIYRKNRKNRQTDIVPQIISEPPQTQQDTPIVI